MKFMKNLSLSLSLCLVGFVLSASVLAHTAPIESGPTGYTAVRLPPEVYSNANADLSDLLIKDEAGEVVPYFIRKDTQSAQSQTEQHPLSLINSYVKEDAFYFDYQLKETLGYDVLATSLVFATDSTFAKNIRLYGSYDNRSWDFVQGDTLYQIDGNRKLELTFTQPQKYTHYRLELANNLEQVSFHSAYLQYSMSTVERSYFTQSLTPAYTVKNEDKRTVLTLSGLKNLRLQSLTLATDSQFQREVEALGNGKQLYNLSFDNVAYRDLTLPLSGNSTTEDTLSVTIYNYDDKPIAVTGVTVSYYADELVFENKGGRYTLHFSGDPAATAPIYDIGSYRTEILKGALVQTALGPITLEKASEPPKELDYRPIFNIVLLVITAILGVVILLKLRKKPN